MDRELIVAGLNTGCGTVGKFSLQRPVECRACLIFSVTDSFDVVLPPVRISKVVLMMYIFAVGFKVTHGCEQCSHALKKSS